MRSRIGMMFVSAVCALGVSGCFLVGAGVGARLAVPLIAQDEVFTMQEVVFFDTPVQNLNQLGDAAMLSLEFRVAGRGPNTARYTREGSTLNFVVLGQTEHLDVTLTLSDDRRSITLDVLVNGNLGAADEARVRGIVNDIVAKLRELHD